MKGKNGEARGSRDPNICSIGKKEWKGRWLDFVGGGGGKRAGRRKSRAGELWRTREQSEGVGTEYSLLGMGFNFCFHPNKSPFSLSFFLSFLFPFFSSLSSFSSFSLLAIAQKKKKQNDLIGDAGARGRPDSVTPGSRRVASSLADWLACLPPVLYFSVSFQSFQPNGFLLLHSSRTSRPVRCVVHPTQLHSQHA